MATKRLASLCQSVLPPEFEQLKRRLPKLQQFLEHNLPEPVNRQVTALSVDRDQVVLAAGSPTVASYLRLHSREIRQQLQETFGLQQEIKIRTVPDALLKLNPPPGPPRPRPVGAGSIDALKRNAEWIEDEALREALRALARSLESGSD